MSCKKPWEEDWREMGHTVTEGPEGGWSLLLSANRWEGEELAVARARLAAAAPDLVRALLAVEFATYDGAEIWCPWCSSHGVSSHNPDCLRQAALRKAGVIG